MTQLTGLRMTSGEKVTDYLTKAEGLKLDLAEAGEVISDALVTAMILKGLPSDFDSVVAVLNFGTAKGYFEMKQNLVNFAASRGLCVSNEPSMTISFTQSGGSLQRDSSVERWGTELRTATVGRQGFASTVVRKGIWLHLAGRDSKRAQVEDVARVIPATIQQLTSSALGLSGLVATTRGALSFSLTLGATAS